MSTLRNRRNPGKQPSRADHCRALLCNVHGRSRRIRPGGQFGLVAQGLGVNGATAGQLVTEGRAFINVLGNAVATIVIGRWEKDLDMDSPYERARCLLLDHRPARSARGRQCRLAADSHHGGALGGSVTPSVSSGPPPTPPTPPPTSTATATAIWSSRTPAPPARTSTTPERWSWSTALRRPRHRPVAGHRPERPGTGQGRAGRLLRLPLPQRRSRRRRPRGPHRHSGQQVPLRRLGRQERPVRSGGPADRRVTRDRRLQRRRPHRSRRQGRRDERRHHGRGRGRRHTGPRPLHRAADRTAPSRSTSPRAASPPGTTTSPPPPPPGTAATTPSSPGRTSTPTKRSPPAPPSCIRAHPTATSPRAHALSRCFSSSCQQVAVGSDAGVCRWPCG
ncbi:hypothetical protein QFZ76_000656 [Streptomyces sp. V4I2]|nr:hypothetical protein [Streptomyces sp. V4I2]